MDGRTVVVGLRSGFVDHGFQLRWNSLTGLSCAASPTRTPRLSLLQRPDFWSLRPWQEWHQGGSLAGKRAQDGIAGPMLADPL